MINYPAPDYQDCLESLNIGRSDDVPSLMLNIIELVVMKPFVDEWKEKVNEKKNSLLCLHCGFER